VLRRGHRVIVQAGFTRCIAPATIVAVSFESDNGRASAFDAFDREEHRCAIGA
jgi:hypothetical protein